MGWFTIDYEVLLDKDDFSIINVLFEKTLKKKHYLESVNMFMNGLNETFKINNLTHQFKVDFPREKCYVNNILIKNYQEFLEEIEYNNTIKETIILLCTQASAFPITAKLFEKFSNFEEDIHVSDFQKNNPLIFRFKIFDTRQISVDIEKKFHIITIENGEPVPQRTIRVNTFLTIDPENKDHENNDVYYSIAECGI